MFNTKDLIYDCYSTPVRYAVPTAGYHLTVGYANANTPYTSYLLLRL